MDRLRIYTIFWLLASSLYCQFLSAQVLVPTMWQCICLQHDPTMLTYFHCPTTTSSQLQPLCIQFGNREIFWFASVVYTAGAIGCACAQSPEAFIALR